MISLIHTLGTDQFAQAGRGERTDTQISTWIEDVNPNRMCRFNTSLFGELLNVNGELQFKEVPRKNAPRLLKVAF